MTTKELAKEINTQCKLGKYYWAIGLIKQTLPIWKQTSNQYLLCQEAQEFIVHYS